MKSEVGGAFPDQETFKETDFSSNFADFKPNRPENHKAEFKKTRESLTMIGDVDYQPEASSFQDLKPKRPTINRWSRKYCQMLKFSHILPYLGLLMK